jgi:SAM-dependent methyltransferase
LHAPSSWHHGLVAEYWAAVNLDAPEIELYRHFLRSPILDAGCGAGRLLVPLQERGFDIDGCDASADMIDRCRQRAPDSNLWVSRLHKLEPPRRYASIICSGVLGLGSTREQDIQALKRLYDALLPEGTLVLDNEEKPFRWRVRGWNTPSTGEISLSSRVDAVDAADRCIHLTIRAETRDGRREEHTLTMRQWYRDELVPLLESAGFATVDVCSGIDEHTVVYIATRREDSHVQTELTSDSRVIPARPT